MRLLQQFNLTPVKTCHLFQANHPQLVSDIQYRAQDYQVGVLRHIIGHPLCDSGHQQCPEGHPFCDSGHPLCDSGHPQCAKGHPLYVVRHPLCAVGDPQHVIGNTLVSCLKYTITWPNKSLSK